MSQHASSIANQPGAAFRADLNNFLLAAQSMNSGPTAPSPTFSNMPWADTTAGILKRRNASNSGWIEVMPLASGLIVGTDVQAHSAFLDALVTAGVVVLPGKNTVWMPAGAMTPRATNGPSSSTIELPSNKVMVKTLDFDTATQEYAQFSISMPKSWNEGTLTFVPVWRHAATSLNFGVAWQFEAVAVSDDGAMDVSFGTAVVVTDAGGTTNDFYRGAESSSVTVAGSPATNDLVIVQVSRKVSDGSDTMGIDAGLIGVVVFYTTDAANDA